MLNTVSKAGSIYIEPSSELGLIAIVIRRVINGRDKQTVDLNPHSINWERFRERIIYHEIIPFAYLCLKDSNLSIPEDLRQFLKNNYYYTLLHCEKLWQEFLRVLKEFENKQIPILPIKGIHFLYDIYADFPTRPMVDIDILVREEDILGAEVILSDLGYKKELSGLKEKYWREDQCHLAFFKRERGKRQFIVELHWGIDFKRKKQMVLAELWNRTEEISLDEKRIKLLSPEDAFFSLVLHNRRFGKILNLKNTIDLILLLNKYSYRFDWDYVLSRCRKYSLSAPVFFSIYKAEFLLDLAIPKYARKELKIPNWKKRLIQRFIENNTFPVEMGSSSQAKGLYLKAHFLLCDNLWEPVFYILNIPQEQFAKYYGLLPYTASTNWLYRIRFLHIFNDLLLRILRTIVKKLPWFAEKI